MAGSSYLFSFFVFVFVSDSVSSLLSSFLRLLFEFESSLVVLISGLLLVLSGFIRDISDLWLDIPHKLQHCVRYLFYFETFSEHFGFVDKSCASIFPADIHVSQLVYCSSSWIQFRHVNHCNKYTEILRLVKGRSHFSELSHVCIDLIDAFVHIISKRIEPQRIPLVNFLYHLFFPSLVCGRHLRNEKREGHGHLGQRQLFFSPGNTVPP